MRRLPFKGTAALGSMIAGTTVAVVNMFYWSQDQYYFAHAASPTSFVLLFYMALSISVFLLLLGFHFAYQYLQRASSVLPFSSLLAIIGSAVSDSSLRRLAVATTAVYGLLYAFASSILVFQPQVDFATAYGATGAASWTPFPCCGGVGTYPELIVYFTPAHLALQLVPLSLLLLFIVPPLVGLNLSIAMFSVRRTVAKVTGRWMVACGAAIGLFTACPTCAGFFLAESVGGVGATALAVALAPYQAAFIAVSIPLLVLMPFFFARRVRKVGTFVSPAGLKASVEKSADPPLAAGNR